MTKHTHVSKHKRNNPFMYQVGLLHHTINKHTLMVATGCALIACMGLTHAHMTYAQEQSHHALHTSTSAVSRFYGRTALQVGGEAATVGKTQGSWSLSDSSAVTISYMMSDEQKNAVNDVKNALSRASSALQASSSVSSSDEYKNLNQAYTHYNNEVSSVNDSTNIDVNHYKDMVSSLDNARNALDSRRSRVQSQTVSSASSSVSTTVSGSHSELMAQAGISASDYSAVEYIISQESGWNPQATNASSGAYGLPQALPASKMASAGSDWQTNPVTQLKWFKNYCVSRYGSIQGALAYWNIHHSY